VEFANWLDRSLAQRSMSPAMLARTLGVADAQVSRWRRGQVVPTVQSLQRIADTFGVPRASLDRLAGYPAEGDGPGADPELDAAAGRLRELLTGLPPSLRGGYVDACAALAQTLANSLESLRSQHDESGRGHSIGFRPGPEA
jgi:transcriptional regulator with XRE-family HTH domain